MNKFCICRILGLLVILLKKYWYQHDFWCQLNIAGISFVIILKYRHKSRARYGYMVSVLICIYGIISGINLEHLY